MQEKSIKKKQYEKPEMEIIELSDEMLTTTTSDEEGPDMEGDHRIGSSVPPYI